MALKKNSADKKSVFKKTISKIERSKREVMKNGPPDSITTIT